MAALDRWTGPDGAELSFVEVRSMGRVRVVAGGPPSEAVGEAFEADARSAGARTLWFGVETPEAVLHQRPSVVIGAEPVWDAGSWARVVARKRSVRAQIARARNKGVAVEAWTAERAARSDALREVLKGWLGTRGLPPLGFLADPFVLDAPGDRRFFVATHEGRVVGYLVLRPGAEVFVEWILRSRAAPNGTAALLLDTAVRSLPEGASFTLGLVPLSTFAPLSDDAPGLLVRGLLSWTRAHATRFYNFEGLERFKAKFAPDRWRPLHLVTDGRPITVLTFHAVAAAFAAPRGPVRFVARALADAVVEELRRGLRWASTSLRPSR